MTADRNPQQAFAAALTAFQAALPHVGKDQKANVGKYAYAYADLTTITETLLPLLSAQGLSWSATPTLEQGFVLRYRLTHIGGHSEGGCYPLPDPSKATAQEVGSAITYARRYALCAITGLAPGGDDDDGQKASAARPPAVEVGPLEQARADLRALMDERGLDWSSVTPAFASKYGDGEVIGNADAARLAEFVVALRTGELA